MKKRVTVFVLFFGLALLLGLAGCTDPQDQLSDTMKAYTGILQEGIPEDVSLTIYLDSLNTLYPTPQSVERLIEAEEWSIVVKGNEMAKHPELLKKLNADVLRAADEPPYIP